MKSDPEIVPTAVGLDADKRLAELHLSRQALLDAVAFGQADRHSCTENDPSSSIGIRVWGKTVRGLRDFLTPSGWRRTRRNGVELTLSPDGTTAIAVTMGDAATGSKDGMPRTKYEKGQGIQQAVKINGQLSFWPTTSVDIENNIEPGRPLATWLLLLHAGADSATCELSLPSTIDDDGYVAGWRERIILGDVYTGTPLGELLDVEPEIQFDVTRRQEA